MIQEFDVKIIRGGKALRFAWSESGGNECSLEATLMVHKERSTGGVDR